MIGRLVAGMTALAVSLSAPAFAAPLPDPATVTLPEERAVMDEMISILSPPGDTPAGALARLDPLLARLDRPTPLRGILQHLRGELLFDDGRRSDAILAAEEAIRLLPDYAGPLLLAARIHTYRDEPAPAADYVLRASRVDPELVRQVDEYELGGLVQRLREQREDRRLVLLAERLIELDWKAGLNTRSMLVREVIEAKLADGDIAAAERLVPRILDPDDAYRLLMLDRYRPLWPAIERWAGPRLERLWPIFLSETRARWKASGDAQAARDYAGALTSAGHLETLVAEFMPLFGGGIDVEGEEYLLLYSAPPVAEALARLGRTAEIEPFYQRIAALWPPNESANGLNVAGNRAVARLFAGNPAGAADDLADVIAQAHRWGGEVNSGALGAMNHYLACALHRAGRPEDAVGPRAVAEAKSSTSDQVLLELCARRPERARALLLEGLARADGSMQGLFLLQPRALPPRDGELGREIEAGLERLRSDPEVLAAAAKGGRILSFARSAGAPPERLPPGR